MYPGSIFVWHDESGFKQPAPQTTDNSPLFFAVSSFDKGPENIREEKGEHFYKMYGHKMRFAANGQPSIQTANIINHGGRVLVKRLVANDAKLANLVNVAQVVSKIHAIAAAEDDINGKTLEEILTGTPGEEGEYAEVLNIISEVGSEVGKTKLTVSPELGTGHKYYWRETDTQVLPLAGKVITSEDGYTEWDGTSELEVADGAMIELIEYSNTNGLMLYGVINVVSKLDHPATTSTVPDNGLNALYMTSKESDTTVGNTAIILSPAAGVGHVLVYKEITDPEAPIPYPTYDVDIAVVDFDSDGWKSWDGFSELTIADGTKIMVCEFSKVYDSTDPTLHIAYHPIKAASIDVVSKLPEDDRTSESVEPVIPTTDKYIIVNQENTVKWYAMTIENCKTEEEVMEEAAKLWVDNTPEIVRSTNTDIVEGVGDDPDDPNYVPPSTVTTVTLDITISSNYPLIVAIDNGRGFSVKAVKLTADLNTSKDLSSMMYNMEIYEGTDRTDAAFCSINPSMVVNNTLYGLHMDTCEQVIFNNVEGVYQAYIDHLVSLTGYTAEALSKCDLIAMTNNKGTSLVGISLDEESIDLGADYGVMLQSGGNGEFGDAPFGTEPWIEAALAVIDDYDALWDPDTYKICAAFDANYPEPVKDKFAWFANEREDFNFFRDYGIDIKSYSAIAAKHAELAEKEECANWFNGEYFTTYDILDPETRVRERVTMMYDFAAAMVDHFAKGAYRPAAGIANGMILPSAIEGSVNFTPYNKPQVKQKALIDDMRVNYAIFHEGQCVVQSTYTSNPEKTQLSFVNNVLIVEEVIRAVRIACPKHRFTFVTNNDFSSYAEAVNNVLKGFRPLFAELKFEWMTDPLKAQQKIFTASISVRFNNWAQTEYFDIYCLGENA